MLDCCGQSLINMIKLILKVKFFFILILLLKIFKIKGIEAVRRDNCALIRMMMNECLNMVLI